MQSTIIFIIIWGARPRCQRAVMSTYHFAYWPQCHDVIFSLDFCQLTIFYKLCTLSMCNFVNLPFCHFVKTVYFSILFLSLSLSLKLIFNALILKLPTYVIIIVSYDLWSSDVILSNSNVPNIANILLCSLK